MLETFQRKRHMFLGLGLLVVTTIVVLIVESHYAVNDGSRKRAPQIVIENNSTCYMREEFTVVQECHPCSEFDIVSRSLGVCVHTRYKELLRCKSGEIVIRSCDNMALIDQRNFIKFEVVCFVVSVISYFVCYARDRVLTRRANLKIERQLNRMQ